MVDGEVFRAAAAQVAHGVRGRPAPQQLRRWSAVIQEGKGAPGAQPAVGLQDLIVRSPHAPLYIGSAAGSMDYGGKNWSTPLRSWDSGMGTSGMCMTA